MDYCVVFQLFALVSLSGVCKSQIMKPPNSQTVSSNDTGVFNCSMPCSQQLPVTWYMTLPTNGRTVPVSPYTSLTQVKNIYGIEVSRGTVNECPQGGYLVEQLFVKAKQQFNLMPVQCSTVCISGDCSCDTTQVYFSKLAILNVLASSGTSSGLPSTGIPSTPTLCPSPSLSVPGRITASGDTRSYVTTTVTATTTVTLSQTNPVPSPLKSTGNPSQEPITSSVASYV